MKKIRFSFAKRHGVLLGGEEEGIAHIWCRCLPSAPIIAELRRQLQMSIQLMLVDDVVFNQHLVKAYETDASTAMQMA